METGFNSACQSLFLVGQILYKTLLLQMHSSATEAGKRFLFSLFVRTFSHMQHTLLPLATCCQNQSWLMDSTPSFSSLGLSLSLTPSRLSIRNNNNRWEPPPGSAWECSGIIAAGTPSTITQRTHTPQSEVGRRAAETWQPWHTSTGTAERGWVPANASLETHPEKYRDKLGVRRVTSVVSVLLLFL